MPRYSVFFFLFLLTRLAVAADTFSVLTWNIRDFGQSKDDQEIRFIAEQVRRADIVAIQEVVAGYGGAQAVARLADELNRMGSRWDYRISDPTNSPKFNTERYAFLWKTSRAQLVGNAALEKRLDARISREPYVGRFRVAGKELLIVNMHAVPWDKNPEQEVRYLGQMTKYYPGIPIIYAGDYNLADDHPVFDHLEALNFRPVLNSQPTTVRKKTDAGDGSYLLHPIDNIFYPAGVFRLVSGSIIDFIPQCTSLETANEISDHVPVWVKLEWQPLAPEGRSGGSF